MTSTPLSRGFGLTWLDRILVKIPFDYSLAFSLGTLILKTHRLFLGYGGLIGCATYISLAAMVLIVTYKSLNLPGKLDKMLKKTGIKIGLALMFLLLLLFVDLSSPAHAFFFGGVQDALEGVIPDIPQQAEIERGADFIFGFLQIALIAYIVYSVVKVIGAIRDDETDFKTVAQKPLAIVGILVGGDYLVSLVGGETTE